MGHAESLSLARRAGAFLLDLHDLSHTLPAARFQPAVLARLRRELPFRSAWWGMMRVQAGRPAALHASYIDAMPDEWAACWDSVKHEDELASQVLGTPGIAVSARASDLRRNAAHLFGIAERFGIGSAMSIAVTDPHNKLRTFLSLYRGTDAPPFDDEARGLHEILMPHLAAAWRVNWQHHLDGLRERAQGPRGAMAVIDSHGLLQVADPDFAEVMRSEWPRWRRAALPAPLHDAIARRESYDGQRLRIEASRERDLIVLQARPRNPFDTLSPREAEVAACYRDGLSYKEISQRLSCSPFTVRHHLRAIYDKLGVSNKAEFIRLGGGERAARGGDIALQ